MNAGVDINETCLTVAEVAERLKVNEETARRLFLNEPGVIVICYPRKGVRVYPIPLTPERMAPVKSLSGGTQVPHVFTPEDFQVANRLLNRFTTALNPYLKDVTQLQVESGVVN